VRGDQSARRSEPNAVMTYDVTVMPPSMVTPTVLPSVVMATADATSAAATFGLDNTSAIDVDDLIRQQRDRQQRDAATHIAAHARARQARAAARKQRRQQSLLTLTLEEEQAKLKAQAQEQALYEASVAKKAQARHSAGTAQARPRKEGLLKAARVKKGAATTSADDDDAYDAEEAALIAQVEEENSVVRRRRVRARPSKEQPKLDEDVAPSSTPLLQAPEDDFSLADVEIAKMLQEQQRKSRERPFDSPSALGRLPGSLSALSHVDVTEDQNGSIHGGASRFL
jgi:hypothetical protein